MKSKEKYRKTKLIIILIFIMILFIMYMYISKKYEKKSYAYEQNNFDNLQIQISNAETVNLDEIIQRNTTNMGYREEIFVKEEELEYITKYRNNSNLYKGTTQVSQEGRNGIQKITTKKTYDKDGKVIKEEQMSAVVTKSSINKIIEIGTKKREKKNIYVSTSTNLDFNIALNKPSGFTLEQFKKVLTDSKDVNNIFGDNAEYFYYIEKQYGINGIFVASVGIHESAWGTSKIAKNKYNLFGYGAYDSNPYNGAYKFESYSESIDLVARVFVKYYINPKGTSIYDGQKASGKYYSGNTLAAVNKRYATDKNWCNAVYKHMKYLYGKK
ncbi:MAG: hypothetical protein HFJ17_04025 [Clostridia bacterium]|nr:hypothetical protein [Clostridia bacterium]